MPLTKDALDLVAALSPTGLYCTGAESLRITSLNAAASVVVTLGGRFLLYGEPEPRDVADTHTPNTDRTAATKTIPLGRGWLQAVSVIVSTGAPVYGQTFVRVDVVRGTGPGATVVATLLQGLVTAAQRLGWPGSPITATIERPGAMRSVTGANPAANNEWSETVPTGARWKPLAVQATLVTDANAAARLPLLIVDDGTTVLATIAAATTQAASLTHSYVWTRGGYEDLASTSSIAQTLPDDLVLLAGFRIRTSTGALQVGDNWGAPQLLVEEWLEGA